MVTCYSSQRKLTHLNSRSCYRWLLPPGHLVVMTSDTFFAVQGSGEWPNHLEGVGLWSFFSEYLCIPMCQHLLQELGIGPWVKNSKICGLMEMHSRCLMPLTYVRAETLCPDTQPGRGSLLHGCEWQWLPWKKTSLCPIWLLLGRLEF